MPILAIDTASRWTAIGLYDEVANAVLSNSGWYATLRQTVELAPAIHDQMGALGLNYADLTGIAVAIGPGSYTGLRIGLAVAQGIATVHDTVIVGVDTHDIVAAAIPPTELPLYAIVEAGRKRILQSRYEYRTGKWVATGQVDNPTWPEFLASLDLLKEPCLVAGEIPQKIKNEIAEDHPSISMAHEDVLERSAEVLAKLGYAQIQEGKLPNQTTLMPNYLRNP